MVGKNARIENSTTDEMAGGDRTGKRGSLPLINPMATHRNPPDSISMY